MFVESEGDPDTDPLALFLSGAFLPSKTYTSHPHLPSMRRGLHIIVHDIPGHTSVLFEDEKMESKMRT
jgi:hypothetical protein